MEFYRVTGQRRHGRPTRFESATGDYEFSVGHWGGRRLGRNLVINNHLRVCENTRDVSGRNNQAEICDLFRGNEGACGGYVVGSSTRSKVSSTIELPALPRFLIRIQLKRIVSNGVSQALRTFQVKADTQIV